MVTQARLFVVYCPFCRGRLISTPFVGEKYDSAADGKLYSCPWCDASFGVMHTPTREISQDDLPRPVGIIT